MKISVGSVQYRYFFFFLKSVSVLEIGRYRFGFSVLNRGAKNQVFLNQKCFQCFLGFWFIT